VARSEITVDLPALRRNVIRLREAAGGAELWAVVKADAYGHGVADVARTVLAAGASGLCVNTVAEGAALRLEHGDTRILVMGPVCPGEEAAAQTARLEVAVSSPTLPAGLPVHLKVDTGMGRWGMSAAEVSAIRSDQVVGLMSHLATADGADETFALQQIERFAELAEHAGEGVVRHLANSAATLRFPQARYDAVRCGIAIYGLSPFRDDPARHGLEPVLSWRSHIALTKRLDAGESTGYERAFVAERRMRIGIVPVGYGDGFSRAMSGAEVLVEGVRRRILGRVSMDSFAVELSAGDVGAPVTLIGDGLLAEEHARHLETITYEVTCMIRSGPERARRTVIDG
jgi:alanine racemase